MPVVGREPVMIIKGVISSIFIVLIAAGIPVDGTAEAALQGAVPVVLSIVAAVGVHRPFQPTVFAAGLVSGIAVFLAAWGLDLPETTIATLQGFIVLAVSFLTRDRVAAKIQAPAVAPTP